MKIYTKTGDQGETSLFGGKRVSKSSERIETYGTVDELNSFLGLTISEIKDEKLKSDLLKIQNQLFVVGTDLATPESGKSANLQVDRTPESYINETELLIDEYNSRNDELKNFILPGGTKSSALLHVCRTISRRAERRVVSLSQTEEVNKTIIVFFNRLSDLFFVLARYENKIAGIKDIDWNK